MKLIANSIWTPAFSKWVKVMALVLLVSSVANGGGIRGTIKAQDGTALAYATLFVKQTGTGVISDLQGHFEVLLPPGNYDIVFQYLGYETVSKSIEIGEAFLELDITLKAQVMMLPSVTVRGDQEDPAYTIMRKAIAKANYHIQQIDKYSAKVYIKGKGKLTDYPWLAKKALEKEGITKDRLFISESVSEIKYTRPNKFEEKVIAIYTSGKDRNNTGPNAYVFGSIYQPEMAETISPLSPKAFSYYRFEYLGTFKDQQYDISKIKVTPRSRGDNVIDGVIYIVEDWWSVHSVDFKVTKLGVNMSVKQIYNPIEGKAWLPVSHQFKADGKVFGFEFEGTYQATVKDYKITLNPALPQEMTVVDEKVDKEMAKQVKKFSQKGQQLQQRLEKGKEVTNKELKQLVKEYEKQERKQAKQPEVISETSFKVDSMAYKKDSTFWADVRTTPLDKEEIRGYKKTDSLSEVQRKREEGDSLKPSKNKGFQLLDLVEGDRYKIGKNSDFEIHTPFGGYNTVEGWNLIYKVSYYKRWVKRDSLDLNKRPDVKRLEVTPVGRYAFSRDVFSGFLRTDYRTSKSRLTLETGRYVQQYNDSDPIHPVVNSLTTLLLGDNLMKLYERNFVDLAYRQRIDEKYTITGNFSWARRHELFNRSNYTVFNINKDQFTDNRPVNNELSNTGFSPNTALIGSIGFEARPWQKYYIRNGRKFRAENTSPLLTANYRRGFHGALGSEVKFDQIEIGFKHGIRIGIRGKLDVALKAGKFLNAHQLYFMDYQHFIGNRTPLVTTDPVGSFRLMDYYRYSTSDRYFTANVHYHFRKFLVTTIPYARLLGITENIFVNYLATPTSRNYTEIGYGVEGILRLFRLEVAAGFQNGKYIDYGVRIGVATSIGVNFND